MATQGELIFYCGKMGAGKSTHAQKEASKEKSILISEDNWLANLYPNEIENFEDYISYAPRLKPILEQHVTDLLAAGISVILDFPGNSITQRKWFRKLISTNNSKHTLFYLDASDELCIQQLRKRSCQEKERARFDTEEMFREVTSYFQPPTEEENFNVILVENGKWGE